VAYRLASWGAQGLAGAGKVLVAGAFHHRAVKGQVGFRYRSPGSAGGQLAEDGQSSAVPRRPAVAITVDGCQ
jgi:hypothetical protein